MSCGIPPNKKARSTDCNKTMEDTNEIRSNVYEIGYLIASSVPEEKVSAEAEAVKSIITKAGAEVITEGEPVIERLAYTMRKKSVSGAYDKYDTAYFGWIKFEVGSNKIEGIKKAVDIHPSVLRMLMTSTVRENTYLGKHAPAMEGDADLAASTGATMSASSAPVAHVSPKKAAAPCAKEEKMEVTPASIEQMDKSIDAMVKEV